MILITGASGTIGTALVNAFEGNNYPIRLAFHTPEKAARARALGYDAVTCDYSQMATLQPALAGVERLFLLSNGIQGQAEGEINVVDAARAAGVRRIVKLSVWGAEAEAFAMAAMHRTVERAIEDSGLEWTFLRPNNFMQAFIVYDAPTIRAEGVFYAPAGDARVSHVDARDIARVAVQALTAPGHAGKAYTLSGPRALSYPDVAAAFSEALGKPVRYVDLPEDEPYVLSWVWTDRNGKPVANEGGRRTARDGYWTQHPQGDHERAPLHRDRAPAAQLDRS